MCSCEFCQKVDRAKLVADKLDAEDAAWIWAQMEELEAIGTDLNWYQAVVDGSWPNAKNIVSHWLKRLILKTKKPKKAKA